MGLLGRYLSGLVAAALGLCAAGWLVLTPFAFGYQRAGLHAAARADWATGGGLALVCAATLFCWASAWRGRLRADGVLAGASRRQARRDARERRRLERVGGPAAAPDPAQLLQELRVLLRPLLPETGDGASGDGASGDGASGDGASGDGASGDGASGAALSVPEPWQQQDYGEPEDLPPATATALGDPDDTRAAAEPDSYEPDSYEPLAAAPPAPSGLAAIESILSGGELLMAGVGEEEAW